MFRHYSTPALVLESRSKGEADKEFSFFSQKFGMIRAVGKSIRKIESKLRGGVSPFSVSKLQFIQGRYYKIITYAELVRDFPSLKTNLIKLRTAYKIREMTQRLIKGQERDNRSWELLLRTLQALNNIPVSYPDLIYLYFSFNLLSILGYNPELYYCLECGARLKPKKLYFSPKGGVICAQCFAANRQGKTEISVESVKVLREIEKNGLKHFLKIKIKENTISFLEEVLDFYVSYI